MNPNARNFLIGSGAALAGVVIGSVVSKKVLEKNPEFESLVAYVGGALTGAGFVLLAKDFILTKSESGPILAAG